MAAVGRPAGRLSSPRRPRRSTSHRTPRPHERAPPVLASPLLLDGRISLPIRCRRRSKRRARRNGSQACARPANTSRSVAAACVRHRRPDPPGAGRARPPLAAAGRPLARKHHPRRRSSTSSGASASKRAARTGSNASGRGLSGTSGSGGASSGRAARATAGWTLTTTAAKMAGRTKRSRRRSVSLPLLLVERLQRERGPPPPVEECAQCSPCR
jgi:hypothetical protein